MSAEKKDGTPAKNLKPTGFLAFPSVGQIRDTRKAVDRMKWDVGTVSFMAKIKLHGTNACVRISKDGTVVAQKRKSDVPLDAPSHFGFELWVEANKEYWAGMSQFATDTTDFYVYGEWAGPGIQKSDAVSSIDEKQFFVFACRGMMAADPHPSAPIVGGVVNEFQWILDPAFIETLLSYRGNEMVPLIPKLNVLPWYGTEGLNVDWTDNDQAAMATDLIIERVKPIGKCDPYIKEKFGVEGNGEGLVFYGLQMVEASGTFTLLGQSSKFMFKAKTEEHANVTKSKLPKKYDPPNQKDKDFAAAYVTPARLKQAEFELTNGGELERKQIGDFVKWMLVDIKKEGANDIEELGVNWVKASKIISAQSALHAKDITSK